MRFFSLPFLLLLVQPSFASVSSGGEWRLIRSVVGIGGDVGSKTGDDELDSTIGEPFASAMEGADSFLSGYLSQVPSFSFSPYVRSFSSTGAVAGSGSLTGVRVGEPLALVFSNEMSSGTVPPAVTLVWQYDRLGNPVGSTRTFTQSFSTETQTLVLRDAGGDWDEGGIFELRVGTAALDLDGMPFDSESRFGFSAVRNQSLSNLVPAPGDPRGGVQIPAGAFSSAYSVSVATTADASSEEANRKLDGLGRGARLVSLLRVDAYDSAGQPVHGTLRSNATLLLPYPDADADGVVDGSGGLRTKSLSVWRLDESRDLWVRQRGGQLDAANARVAFPSDHFSVYALIGQDDADVSSVYAFPVPFRPNGGNVARYGSWATGITFTNLPARTKIRIFTVAGSLVREVDVASAQWVWDVKNSGGQTVASGLYLWEVRSDSNRKTGKLVVIK